MTVITNNSILAKLSIHEIIQKHQILELYSSYWAANVALKPHIQMADIQSTLEDSAEIVARVRSFTDKMINKDHLITLRLKDGQANDFLFHTEISPENNEEFLRELVYATLKIDANSFESGVSKEIIDSFIDNYLIYKKQLPEGSKFDNYSIDNLSILLSEIQNLSHQIFEQKSTDNHRDQKEDKLFLKSIIKSLESIYLDLFRYSASSKFVHVADSSSDSSDLSDIDDFVLVDNVDEKIDDKTEDVLSLEHVEEKKEENNVNNNENNDNVETKEEEVKQKEDVQPVDQLETKEDSSVTSEEKVETKEENSTEETQQTTEQTIDQTSDQPENKELNEEIEVKNEQESNIELTNEPKIDLKSSGIIKIAKVESNIENTINEINQLRESVNSLEIDTNEPKLSLKKVEELLRKCLFWGEALMKDLLTLDTISTDTYPQSSEIRPLRKKKAVQIQSLMDEIEQIKSPLKKHQTDWSKLVEQIENEQKEKEKEAEKNNSGKNSNASTPDHSTSSPSTPVNVEKQNSPQVKGSPIVKEEEEEEEDDLYSTLIQQWKLLKLDPQFETEKQRGRYIITASLPGMKDEDFKLKTNEREGSLSISGCRLPSREEVELLKKNLLRRYKFPNETELTKQLFRYGINRFGSFNTSFTLPNNVITSKIEAKYESGILYVIIPVKVQQAPQYQNPYSRGHNPYFGGPSNFYSPNNFFY